MANVIIYDPDCTVIPGRVTNLIASANTPDYISVPNVLISPDISAISAIPYWNWKVVDAAVVEMTQEEKNALAVYVECGRPKTSAFGFASVETGTSSTQPRVKLSVSTTSLVNGAYAVHWSSIVKYQPNTQVQIQLVMDGNALHLETGDGGTLLANYPELGTAKHGTYHLLSGMFAIPSLEGDHTIDLRFASTKARRSVWMKDASIIIQRIGDSDA